MATKERQRQSVAATRERGKEAEAEARRVCQTGATGGGGAPNLLLADQTLDDGRHRAGLPGKRSRACQHDCENDGFAAAAAQGVTACSARHTTLG
jgi:hypothetical protein